MYRHLIVPTKLKVLFPLRWIVEWTYFWLKRIDVIYLRYCRGHIVEPVSVLFLFSFNKIFSSKFFLSGNFHSLKELKIRRFLAQKHFFGSVGEFYEFVHTYVHICVLQDESSSCIRIQYNWTHDFRWTNTHSLIVTHTFHCHKLRTYSSNRFPLYSARTALDSQLSNLKTMPHATHELQRGFWVPGPQGTHGWNFEFCISCVLCVVMCVVLWLWCVDFGGSVRTVKVR